MPIILPPLPYAYDALEPHISADTMHTHHEKHHGGYVKKLNGLIENTPFAGFALEEIVRRGAKDSKHRKIFNNAAQIWNHVVFWDSMSPRGGDGARDAALVEAIERSFGGHAAFSAKFAKAATDQFGSGWVWLVADDEDKLEIVATGNADTPMTQGRRVLLTCDVWEHAYYIDYRNRRDVFVKVFLDRLINWEHAAAMLAATRRESASARPRRVARG